MSGSTFEDLKGTGDGEDWVLVSRDWWRTPYSAVSWTKNEAPSECLLQRIRQQRKRTIYLDGSHSSDAVLENCSGTLATELGAAPDLELHVDLLGVKLADSVLRAYETIVGFEGSSDGTQLLRYSMEDLLPRRRQIGGYDAEGCDTDALRERWVRQVEFVFGGILKLSSEPLNEVSEDEADAILKQSAFSSLWNLDLAPGPSSPVRSRTPSSMTSSIDLTDSETSEALPSTPKTQPSTLESHGSKERHDLSGSPSKRLNASATSFIPSSSSFSNSRHLYEDPLSPSWPAVASSSLLPISDFQFPPLPPPAVRPSSMPSKLREDEHGFYTEVPATPSNAGQDLPRRQAATPNLPTFLLSERRDSPGPSRKSSKTREIVDQMRQGSPRQRIRRAKSKSEDQEEGEAEQGCDGWIRAEGKMDMDARAQRRKELVAVLGSREGVQVSGCVPMSTKGQEGATKPKVNRSRSRDPSKAQSQISEGGWIEGSAPSNGSVVPRSRSKSRPRQHTRNRSSMSVLSVPSLPPTPSIVPVPHPMMPVPCYPLAPTYTYPVPAVNPAMYTGFQQQQTYIQLQMPYPYPAVAPAPYTYPYQPVSVPPRVPMPVLGQYGEPPLSSKVITGSAGMRHTPW
ncbi:hypothetical protein GLOTRDRAFT_111212 [Gloeophyllum trabeum ATCC 11539]|uniref:Uncharacterized protein n=1 Tax=Gloeophyllum trabeum (strain ATCC 11539 / FP-39264 / Madison 617) TaxID=670483 RepID=S7RQZ3_GLOTA|nr:uncharacterized protein GLOTRDRAFT_111212 [Gloeophyllum trabeum ATCC 11539]EPQ55344.1 hypothetical protein GLOTRDRAFT_111212 [Gloeophyllum trabeum ATCC 11539]